MNKTFRAIRVKSAKEFESLLDHATHEAFRVRDYWDMWSALGKSEDEYSVEVNQTPSFWNLAQRACQDAVILRLGRLFDPHPTAVSLGNLLQTLKDHVAVSPALLPQAVSSLDISKLDEQMVSVSDSDATVRKLLVWRNEYMAHRGSKHIAKGSYSLLPELKLDEIQNLVKLAFEILHEYRDRLGFAPIAWGNHEVRDLERLLKLVRAGLETHRD